MKWIMAALLLTGFALPVRAEVVQASADGFVVSASQAISDQTPDDVWQMLIHPEAWWSSEHSWSGDAGNMSLDPHAGGCFCEASAQGTPGSAEHMRVIQAQPGRLLVMRGSLGPLQAEALTGVLTVTTEQVPGTTDSRLTWTYVVGGYSRLPLDQIAPAVDAVVAEQMQRLAAYLHGAMP